MKFIKGVLRFFRSIGLAFLVMLPVAIGGTIYMNRDYLSRDGILLWWEYLTRDSKPKVERPADWGHDTIPPPNSNTLEIASLLRKGDHAGLKALARRDPVAFDHFRDSSPDLAEALDAWVAAQPRSALARVARGAHWRTVGWHRRGASVARKTSETQFRGMREAFDRAEEDFRTAIDLDPSVAIAYRHLLNIYSATNRDEEVIEVWERAISAGAGSARLYAGLFHSLVPWWSGLSGPKSVDVVRGIINEIESGALKGTGDVDLLRAFPDFIEAELLWRSGKREQAILRFEAFVEGRPGLMHLDNYAEHLADMDRKAESLTHFAARLRYEPTAAIVLAKYGKALVQQKLYDEAAVALDHSLAIDPYRPNTLVTRGDLSARQKRYGEALTYYERAKVYAAERAKVWAHTAWLKRHFTGDMPGAAADYRRAVELSPDWTPYRLRYAKLLDQLQDCGAIPQYRTYLALCQQRGGCKETSIRWTKVRWQQLVDRLICSIDGYRLDPQAWIPFSRN